MVERLYGAGETVTNLNVMSHDTDGQRGINDEYQCQNVQSENTHANNDRHRHNNDSNNNNNNNNSNNSSNNSNNNLNNNNCSV